MENDIVPSPRPCRESPELFSDEEVIEIRERSPIQHFESFNEAVCFDVSNSSEDLFPDETRIDLTQSPPQNRPSLQRSKSFTSTGNPKGTGSLFRSKSFDISVLQDDIIDGSGKPTETFDLTLSSEESRSSPNVFVLSDGETDMNQFSRLENLSFGELSSDEELNYSCCVSEKIKHNVYDDDIEYPLELAEVRTPERNTEAVSMETPGNDVVIKTHDVTPMGNYNEMDTPERNKELDKYGLKPLKKSKSKNYLVV